MHSISNFIAPIVSTLTCGTVQLHREEATRQPEARPSASPTTPSLTQRTPSRSSSMAAKLRSAYHAQQGGKLHAPGSAPTAVAGGLVRASSVRSQETAISATGISQPSAEGLHSLAEAGRAIRAELRAGNYAKYGKEVTIAGIGAIELPTTKEGIQNFRALLSASKVDIGLNGVAVLVRKPEGYEGSRLFALKQDNGGTVGGITKQGTIISICKGPGRMEGADNRFTDIIDILCEVHDEDSGGGVPHFACLSSIAELYNRKTGAEMIGVVNKHVEEHTPGWTEKHTEANRQMFDKFVYHGEIDGQPTEIHLPLVGMRMNRELRRQIKETGKTLPKATQDFTDFTKVPSFHDAYSIYQAAHELDQKEIQEMAGKGKQKADVADPALLQAA